MEASNSLERFGISFFSESLIFSSLIDRVYELDIHLEDGNAESSKEFRLVFDNYIGYRVFNESERLSFVSAHTREFSEWKVFKLVSSEFTDWIIGESLNLLDSVKFYHYIIVTSEEIIEVLSYSDPKLI